METIFQVGKREKDGEFRGQKKHKPANSKDEGFLISPGCETSGMGGVYYLDYAGGCQGLENQALSYQNHLGALEKSGKLFRLWKTYIYLLKYFPYPRAE